MVPLILFFFIGCIVKEKKDSVNILKKELYPSIIDSFKLRHSYDEAKWRLYCIFCDDTVKIRKSNINTNTTFGMLELKFGILEKRNDSAIIYFEFFYNDTACTVYNIDFKNDKPYTNGVLFVKDSLVSFTFAGTSFFKDIYEKSRYKNPLQPEVINYIKNNEGKLNAWFREEARGRKIIE